MRSLFLFLGCGSLVLVWCVLPLNGQIAFFAHMTMHMVVVAVAAPLIAFGIAGGRWDPVVVMPRLFAPVPISMLELLVVWSWHAPALHHYARHSVPGLVAEQSMFFFCGLLLWLSAFGGKDPSDSNRAAAGVVGLLLTMMHMVLLGSLLAMTPRPLYDHSENHGASHGGLSPLEDQHLGGAIMLIGGGVSYLLGGLWLSLKIMRHNPLHAGESS